MAERPAVATRVFSRKELADLFGGNPRAIAAFEAIGKDVNGVLPDASLANAQAAEGAQATADQAVLDAAAAQAAANAAQATADQAVLDAAAAQTTADAAQADIDAHEELTAAHGTTGDVVGTTDEQTLSNKTLAAGTKLAGQTLAPGVGTPDLGTAGPTGAPATWLQININGADYLLPLWAV